MWDDSNLLALWATDFDQYVTRWQDDFDVSLGNNFMGPSLWRTSSFASMHQYYVDGVGYFNGTDGPKYGSHIDMLHQSPLCMGIEVDF